MFGSKCARLLTFVAAGLTAASAGPALAQQTPSTTAPEPQLQPSVPAQETPPTTVTPRPTPQNWSRYDKVRFTGPSTKPKSVTAAVHITKEDPSPARGYSAPTSMAADPENPRVIVAAVANMRNRTCHLLRSRDAGATWEFSKASPSPAGYPFCTSTMSGVPEANLAWGRDGVLYYGLMAYDVISGQEGPRDGRASIALARSRDLGDSWEVTLVENNRGRPPEQGDAILTATGVTGLAVDTSGERDIVYVGYSRSYINAPTGSPLTTPRPIVAVSKDAGATFQPGVNLNDFVNLTRTIEGQSYKILMRTGFGAPFITVHNGTLLAVTGSDFPPGTAPAPPPAAGQGLSPGTFYAYPNPQLIARSTDQGTTWTVKELGPPIYAGAGSMTGLAWTPKGAENGTFVAVYAATPESSTTTGLADMVVQRSTDDGLTWTPPLAISDDTREQNATSVYPQMQVAPGGRVDAVWWDNRGLADVRFHVRYSYSTDGGQTWAPNVQITDQPVRFNYGYGPVSDLRFPPGVASTRYYAAFGWTDTRLADDVSQTEDVFGSIAQFSPLPATSNTVWPWVAAAAGGLVVAGVVLLIALTSRRRPAGTEPTARRRPEESLETR